MVQEARERLKLDDQQVKQLDQIYEETREQVEQARHKSECRDATRFGIPRWRGPGALLRPDQIPLYEQLRAEREARRTTPSAGRRTGRASAGRRK